MIADERLPERFWSKVRVDGSCWFWTGSLTPDGYPRFVVDGARASHRVSRAHRYAYVHLVGDVPDGLELDHRCRNRACVNPSHLEPIAHVVNVARGLVREANHTRNWPAACPHGHAFTPENTMRTKTGRRCRCCNRQRTKRWRDARRPS